MDVSVPNRLAGSYIEARRGGPVAGIEISRGHGAHGPGTGRKVGKRKAAIQDDLSGQNGRQNRSGGFALRADCPAVVQAGARDGLARGRQRRPLNDPRRALRPQGVGSDVV